MKKLIEFLRREPERKYNLKEIEEFNLIPWARNGRTIRNLLEKKRSALKVRITGEGSHRRYSIKGVYLISYLEAYGFALMWKVRKPKHNARSKRGEKSKA